MALGLILGGAVSNPIGCLLCGPGFLCGHVIGFIGYGGYFVGNATDVAIMVAAADIIIPPSGGWEIDDARAGVSNGPGAEGGGAPPSSTHRGVRAHEEDRTKTSSKLGESLDASTQATPVGP